MIHVVRMWMKRGWKKIRCPLCGKEENFKNVLVTERVDEVEDPKKVDFVLKTENEEVKKIPIVGKVPGLISFECEECCIKVVIELKTRSD
jgi:DNA-directed RNA polymerase subunit M/transcription elongation factor TFIIS